MKKHNIYFPAIVVLGALLILGSIAYWFFYLPTAKSVGAGGFVGLNGNTQSTAAPEILPRTPCTDSTIGVFDACGWGDRLETIGVSPDLLIVKKQSRTLTLILDNLDVEEIPDQMQPCIEFSVLYLQSSYPETPAIYPGDVLLKITKLLSALTHTQMAALVVNYFTMEGWILSPPAQRIALSITKELSIYNTSPSFLAWLCDTIDLSACTHAIALGVANCNAQSIACLGSLGIGKISSLHLTELPRLQCLDYQLPSSHHSAGVLTLWKLPSDLDVSPEVAMSIAAKPWNEVSMDMSVWALICSSAGKTIPVDGVLLLNVADMKDLQMNGPNCQDNRTQAKTLVMQEAIKNVPITKAFFLTMVEWIHTNATSVENVYIQGLADKKADADLNEFLETTAPIVLARLPRLNKCLVNGFSIPIAPPTTLTPN
ncbi:hypothetical protein NEDG_01131 [Nematocida displodere]|uniref:Uncharacterized protein n=1 Tax=Nematocida displodere TaxID=1805483 RepID=A0A177ECV2_9MICR|nr:hypothetical protein NEDG_01131 [Nematocida displodere]